MMKAYNLPATKEGFNTTVRYLNLVSAYADEIASGVNLADMLKEDLQSSVLQGNQIMPIVNTLLHDKFKYHGVSLNFTKTIESADKIHSILSQWIAFNIVLVYYDPVSGAVPVNPMNKSALEQSLPFVAGEYALLYVGNDADDKTLLVKGAQDIVKVLNGRSYMPKKEYLKSVRKARTATPTPPSPPPASPSQSSQSDSQPSVQSDSRQEDNVAEGDSGAAPLPTSQADPTAAGYRVTPKYSVLVTNELFHNGNVEAWKKIIESYVHKFPKNEVLIWYDRERIKDINTLFKWGKVKNGTPIIFSVAGTEIGGVSKLQRYLFEGASPRFEAFLQGAHGQILGLF